MSKFERAKKQTIEKMDDVLRALVPYRRWRAVRIFGKLCGFCDAYRLDDPWGIKSDCRLCPLYKSGYKECYDRKWYTEVRAAIESDSNEAIPCIFAIKMWIESLEE